MAGAQHVSTICLTYCLLSKGLWHSRIWVGSRSAGQVQSSPPLCAGTMAAGPQLGSVAAARAEQQPRGRARSGLETLQLSPPASQVGRENHRGLARRNHWPQHRYCSLFILLAAMTFVLYCVSFCKFAAVPQIPNHQSFYLTDEHHYLKKFFLLSPSKSAICFYYLDIFQNKGVLNSISVCC